MHARQTLDLMEGLKAHLSYDYVQGYVGIFLDSIKNSGGIRFEGTTSQVGEWFANGQRRALEVGTPYFLSDEMLPVVQYAASGLTGTEAFAHDLFPSDHGFLVYENGRPIIDRRGRKMIDKALVWSRTVGHLETEDGGKPAAGTLIVMYADADDDRDEVSQDLVTRNDDGASAKFFRSLGRLQMSHVIFIPDGAKVGPESLPSHDFLDEYGQPIQADNPTRMLMSFLLMLRQSITSTSKWEASPKQAQRYAKKRLPSYVTVVQMRRISGIHRAEGESHIEWANRWLVTGHWRHQPVGPNYPGAIEEQPGEFYVRLWIAPYVKGPDGAPLKPSTKKVFALTR